MRFNSARPIRALTAKEQDGLREVLFPAEQPKVFTRNSPDDSPDGLRASDKDKKPRKLKTREIDFAEGFFEDKIDLGEVEISDKSLVGRMLGEHGEAMTVENTIYGNNMSDDTLIHELVHVWQYSNELLSPVRGALWQLAARAIGQRDKLYKYNVASAGDPNRKPFREYGFEQQAAILQDAFRVTVQGFPPIRNEGYKGSKILLPNDAALFELYHLFMWQFEQWHDELQPSSSSSTPSTEEEN